MMNLTKTIVDLPTYLNCLGCKTDCRKRNYLCAPHVLIMLLDLNRPNLKVDLVQLNDS